MQCREGDVSTTERGELFIANGHGHKLTAEFMLAINNWKVEVKRGYLASRVITFANNLPDSRDKKKKPKQQNLTSFKQLLEIVRKEMLWYNVFMNTQLYRSHLGYSSFCLLMELVNAKK